MAAANTPHGPGEATADNIQLVRNIAEALTREEGASPRTHLAVRRWKNSGANRDVADQFIELCIALEALYADSNQEATYKVASRRARHLREHGDERRKLHDEIKKSYSRASHFAHGNATAGKKADKTQIEKMRSACRDGIIKILHEPVDLTELSLGK